MPTSDHDRPSRPSRGLPSDPRRRVPARGVPAPPAATVLSIDDLIAAVAADPKAALLRLLTDADLAPVVVVDQSGIPLAVVAGTEAVGRVEGDLEAVAEAAADARLLVEAEARLGAAVGPVPEADFWRAFHAGSGEAP